VVLAHQIAMENPSMVLAEGVGAMEFPELSEQFRISSVPDTVINNDVGRIIGAVPEQNMLTELKRIFGA
jgi:hypothetical protein